MTLVFAAVAALAALAGWAALAGARWWAWALVAGCAAGFAYGQARRRQRLPTPPPLRGRQQIRGAIRREAARQLGGAPASRQDRREAERELVRRFQQRQREGQGQ